MTAPGGAPPSPPAQPSGPKSGVWTVLDLLRWTTEHFAGKGIDTPRLDAECLLARALGTDRLRLYLDFEKPVLPAERDVFRELVRRRGGERVPVAQLLGEKEFWSLTLRVTPDVLVPRPDTETLVQAVLDALPADSSSRILDLGTGSGAVALALAHERPAAVITATDVSQEALKIAQENAEKLGVADRIRFLAGDGLDPVRGERFDWIVSNPPYVAETARDGLPPELAHEPPGALFAGPDGMALLDRLIREAPDALAPGGGLALEHDPGQAEAVGSRCREAGLSRVVTHRDLGGRLRVTVARLPGDGEPPGRASARPGGD